MKHFLLLFLLVVARQTFAQPAITSFTPASGPIGTAVTINGTGFSPTPTNNIVYFGATRATVTAASSNQLTTVVPTGATHQPISVVVNGLIAHSRLPFNTTYLGWGILDVTSFKPKVDITTINYGSPRSSTICDLNGDGKPDLVVANSRSNSISVFINIGTSGTISYGARVDITTHYNPSSVAFGDLNGDGKLDLAVANQVGSVSVLLNTGTSGAISFAIKYINVGVAPYSVAIGDLDGDGKADLAVVNSSSNTVSVLRNNGTSGGAIIFDATVNINTGIYPQAVVIGDFDGDRKADLAVTNHNNNKVSVFRNIGSPGTINYAVKEDFDTGSSPTSIALGDLDGDGKIDLAVVNFTSKSISVFRNISTLSTINFEAKFDYPIGNYPNSVAIGDLDGDGKPDLAVTNESDNKSDNKVSVFRNTGTSGTISYTSKVDYTTGIAPSSVAIGDLDGDGKSDIVVTNNNSSTVSILQHELLFGQTITFNPLPSKILGDAPFALTASSTSGLPISYTSSNPSVATISGNTVQIVGRGNTVITASQPGNGIYAAGASVSHPLLVGPPPVISNFIPSSGPVGTSVTITGIGFSSSLTNNIVFFGATRALVTSASATQLIVTVPVGATYHPITVFSDGLVSYSKLPFNTTYSGWGVVNLSSFVNGGFFSTNTDPKSVAIGDLDGDRRADLAVTKTDVLYNRISIFHNTGTSGTISYAPKIDFIADPSTCSVAIGDLDGDGKLDMAVANQFSNNVSVFLNTGTSGTISYAAKRDFATGSTPRSIAIGDLDGDGKADLAVANAGSNNVSVLRNISTSGLLSFATRADFPTSSAPSSVAIGDLDGDGKADLAVANKTNNRVSVLRNSSALGAISYDASIYFNTGLSPNSVAIGDLDGDGKLDLVVANEGSNNVSVLRNTSTSVAISYNTKQDFNSGSGPNSVAIGDLDGDGKADLAVANGSSYQVSVLRNSSSLGTINYDDKVDFYAGLSPQNSIAIGDLDGDGKSDLVVTNPDKNIVFFLRHESLSAQIITFNPLANKCINSTFTLSASSSSGLPVTYSSSNPAIASITGNVVTALAAGSVTITASQAGNGSYLPATNVNQVLNISNPVIPTITASGATIFCQGGSVTLTSSAGSSYLWSTGATTPSIAVSASGNYSVLVANANGCSSTSSPVSVIVNAATAITTQPLAIQTVCQGTALSPLSVSATGTGPLTYQWYSKLTPTSTGSVISDATTNIYNPLSMVGTIYYYVVVSGSCGNVTSNDSQVTVNSATITITPSSASICANGSTTLTASGMGNYTWSPSSSLSSSTGATVTAYPISTTVYTVTGNLNGCTGTKNVRVNVTSATASISAPNGTNACTGNVILTANAAATYLWSTGETTQSIYPFGAGVYSVTTYNGSCQSTASITIERNPQRCQIARVAMDPVTPTNQDLDEPTVSKLTTYPNPAEDRITVALPEKVSQATPVILYDVNGKVVASQLLSVGQWKAEIDVQKLTEGIYIVRVLNGETLSSAKVIVLR